LAHIKNDLPDVFSGSVACLGRFGSSVLMLVHSNFLLNNSDVSSSRKIIPILALCFTLLTSLLTMNPASATVDDSCGFGRIQDVDPNTGDTTCTPATWYYESSNDGFTINTYAQMDADSYDIISGVDTYFHLQLVCNARKLQVFVFSAPLDMYPTTDLSGLGSTLIKFDSGSISTAPYHRTSNFNGFYLTNPQTFTQKLINSKTKVSLKFGTIHGTEVMVFPVGDIAKYASKFASKGCSLGKLPVSTKKSPVTWFPAGYYLVSGLNGFAFKDRAGKYNCQSQSADVVDCVDEWIISQKACKHLQLTWGWYSDSAGTNLIKSVITNTSIIALKPTLFEGVLNDSSIDLTGVSTNLSEVKCLAAS